jgi:hypothetical protein
MRSLIKTKAASKIHMGAVVYLDARSKIREIKRRGPRRLPLGIAGHDARKGQWIEVINTDQCFSVPWP